MDETKAQSWPPIQGEPLSMRSKAAVAGGLVLFLILVNKCTDLPSYQRFGAEGDSACNLMANAAAQMVQKSIYAELSPHEAANAISGVEMDAILLSGMSEAQHSALNVTRSTLRSVSQGKESLSLKDIFNKCSAVIGTRAGDEV